MENRVQIDRKNVSYKSGMWKSGLIPRAENLSLSGGYCTLAVQIDGTIDSGEVLFVANKSDRHEESVL